MKEPDPNELLEILELAKDASRLAREMCESITAHAEKWERRLDAKRGVTRKEP